MRLARHRLGKAWGPQVNRVEIELFASRKEAEYAERHAILDEGPEYNRQRSQTSARTLGHGEDASAQPARPR